MNEEKVLQWSIKPTKGMWPTCNWYQWTTTCGRYRVLRLVSTVSYMVIDGQKKPCGHFAAEYLNTTEQHGGGIHTSWQFVGRDSDSRELRTYQKLSTALEAVEKFHRERWNVRSTESNANLVVGYAEGCGLADLADTTVDVDCPLATITSDDLRRLNEEGTKIMSVLTKFKRKDVVLMFSELHFKDVTDKTKTSKLIDFVRRLPRYVTNREVQAEVEVLPKRLQKLLNDLLAVVKSDPDAEIVLDGDEPQPVKKTAKAVTKPKTTKAKAAGVKASTNGDASRKKAAFGEYSMSGLIYWMRGTGMHWKEAVNALEKLGLRGVVADRSVRNRFHEPASLVRPAALTKEQQDKVLKAAGKKK